MSDKTVPVISDLESSPDIFDEFAQQHFSLSPNWGFVEIFGFEEDLLSMIPTPCLGVVLMFDYNSDALAKDRSKERKGYAKQPDSHLFFANQLLSKSCGPIAILHILANHQKTLELSPESVVSKILEKDSKNTGKERGVAFVEYSGDKKLIAKATEYANHIDFSRDEGPSHFSEPQPHFITFLEKDGNIYELDPAKGVPISHGSTNGDLLKKATNIIQSNFFGRNPDSLLFSMMAFVKKD